MSSGIRTMQKRIFKAKGYRPYDHNGATHKVRVPETDPPVYIDVNNHKWPLHPKNFNKQD